MSYPDPVKERFQAEYFRDLHSLFFRCLDDLHPEARQALHDIVLAAVSSDIDWLRSEKTAEDDRDIAGLEEDDRRRENFDPKDPPRYKAQPFNLRWWYTNNVHRLGENSPASDRIEAEVRDWAHTHHIEADWVVEAAIGLLGDWTSADPESPEPSWTIAGSEMWSGLHPRERHLSYSLDNAWWPPLMTRGQAVEFIVKEFKSFLTGWLDERERLVDEKIGVARPKSNSNAERDMQWLVEYWINNKTAERIAKEYEANSANNVEQAVNKLGNRIGFKRN